MKNEDIRIIKTKKALKSSFAKLIAEVPYHKISIIDICREADVHRATFYNYYNSKEDLFSSIIEDTKDVFVSKFFEQNKYSMNSRSDVINFIIDSFIEHCSTISSYLKKVVEAQNPETIKHIMNRSLFTNLYQVLSLFPSNNQNLPKDFICSFYSGALTNIIFWYMDNTNVSKDQLLHYVHYYLKDREVDDYN